MKSIAVNDSTQNELRRIKEEKVFPTYESVILFLLEEYKKGEIEIGQPA